MGRSPLGARVLVGKKRDEVLARLDLVLDVIGREPQQRFRRMLVGEVCAIVEDVHEGQDAVGTCGHRGRPTEVLS